MTIVQCKLFNNGTDCGRFVEAADCCVNTRLGILTSSVSSSVRGSSVFVGRSLVVELVPNLAINGGIKID